MTDHPSIVAGHVAVITGGASGIGLAAARALAARGMKLVIADRDAAALEAAHRALGEETLAVVADVSRREDVERLKEAAERLGPITFLMNNAGREGGGDLFADPALWHATLETNLWGPINGVQLFAPGMIARGLPAVIVNTGSKQGITLPPGDTAYNVSKAALKALTESLAHKLRESGAPVSAHLLIPGFVFTGFTRARGVTEKPAGAWTPEQTVDFMLTSLARGDFYILCPDNEVTREVDEKRIAWAAGDIIENRPALSRWHPDFAGAFKTFMEGK